MKMNNNVYDILKKVALVWLDAIGIFYQTIAEIWNLPFGDEVLKSCVALSILIGALIGISNNKYQQIESYWDDVEEEEE